MIHVLGAGSIGSLFAASLVRRHPVHLLMRGKTLQRFTDPVNNSMVRISQGADVVAEHQFTAEYSKGPETSAIERLVVAVKAHDVKRAVLGLQRRINRETEIVVVHNGMGVREDLLEVWPDAQKRPKLSFAITTAGMKRNPPLWSFQYTGNGTVSISGEEERSPNRLINDIKEANSLFITDVLPREDFDMEQRIKLAVNAVVNPLTAILQCPNGRLLDLDDKLPLQLTRETARILNLNADYLYERVRNVLTTTSSNLSSMLCDIEAMRPLEIDYINGYIVREAERLGLRALTNTAIIGLVRMRAEQIRHETEEAIPLKP